MSAADDLPAAADSTASTEPLELSFLVRMDLRITDPDALIMGARLAAAAAEPETDPEELERQVGTVEDALFCYSNAVGFDALIEDAPGVEVRAVAAEVASGLEDLVIEEEGPAQGDR